MKYHRQYEKKRVRKPVGKKHHKVTFHGRAVPVKRQPRLLDTLLP